MRSFGGVFHKIVGFSNLNAALDLAAKGKRRSREVQTYLARREFEISLLQLQLDKGLYRPLACRSFRIFDPKPRTIACPAFRDRVVHHAVCRQLGPIWEQGFIEHSYACRKGKGYHPALLHAQKQTHRSSFYLKCDIEKFYDSISWARLLQVLTKRFREARLRDLLAVFVQAQPSPLSQGLPIGSLTSQWFANVFLDQLDHYVLQQLRPLGYIRYMDDFVLWSNRVDSLHAMLESIHVYVDATLGLSLKWSAVRVGKCDSGLPFLGMLVFGDRLRLLNEKWRRRHRLVRRVERNLQNGLYSEDEAAHRVQSSLGMLRPLGIRRFGSSWSPVRTEERPMN